MRRFLKILLFFACIIVIAGVVKCIGPSHRSSPDGPPTPGGGPLSEDDTHAQSAVPVTVEKASAQDVPVYAVALGTVSAYQTVNVSPQIGGQLLAMHFQEGKAVAKDAVIAEIDSRSLQASYDQAAAAYAQNAALLATARSNYQRSDNPSYRPYVAHADLDTQRNQVVQLEAALAANTAQMRQAQVQLQFAKVRAPISGIAGIRNIDVGNVVTANTVLVTLTQIQPIYVSFNLPESELNAVHDAQAAGAVQVIAQERDGTSPARETGVLDALSNQINSDSGTIGARAVFPNSHQRLWPGQFVNVRVLLRTLHNATVIPAQAVMRGPNGDYVYLVQADNTVAVRDITQGVQADETHVEVSKGLRPGDVVVTEGQFRLKTHTHVRPMAPSQLPSLSNLETTPTDDTQKQKHPKSGFSHGMH